MLDLLVDADELIHILGLAAREILEVDNRRASGALRTYFDGFSPPTFAQQVSISVSRRLAGLSRK